MRKASNRVSFALNIDKLVESGKFSSESIDTLWKLSEVYQSSDLVQYYLHDDDKWPMAIGQNSSDVNNDRNSLIEAALGYFGSAYTHTKRLQEALEFELKQLSVMHRDSKEVQEWIENLDL